MWGGEGREVLRVLVGACVDLRVTKPGPCNPYCVLVSHPFQHRTCVSQLTVVFTRDEGARPQPQDLSG